MLFTFQQEGAPLGSPSLVSRLIQPPYDLVRSHNCRSPRRHRRLTASMPAHVSGSIPRVTSHKDPANEHPLQRLEC